METVDNDRYIWVTWLFWAILEVLPPGLHYKLADMKFLHTARGPGGSHQESCKKTCRRRMETVENDRYMLVTWLFWAILEVWAPGLLYEWPI